MFGSRLLEELGNQGETLVRGSTGKARADEPVRTTTIGETTMRKAVKLARATKQLLKLLSEGRTVEARKLARRCKRLR
jgi:hypothetical protein